MSYSRADKFISSPKIVIGEDGALKKVKEVWDV